MYKNANFDVLFIPRLSIALLCFYMHYYDRAICALIGVVVADKGSLLE